MWGFHWFPFHWAGLGLGFLGTIAAIVIVIVLVTRNNHRVRDDRHYSSAEQILKDRLARGEITIEQYEELLKKVK